MASLRTLAVVFALTAVSAVAHAQARPLPRVQITLPAGISSEKVDIEYVLYGSFGASGHYGPPSVQASSYTIYASSEGKAARNIKVIVWAPGCKFETFDVSLDEYSDVEQPFLCAPLSSVAVSGQLQPSSLVREKPTEVRFHYIAGWACRFFGFADCMVPQFDMGASVPDTDGSFHMELPDFSSDPVATEMGGDEEFLLTLRGTKTGNLVSFLEPESEDLRSPSGGLKVLSAYPNVTFVLQKSAQPVSTH